MVKFNAMQIFKLSQMHLILTSREKNDILQANKFIYMFKMYSVIMQMV